MSVFGANDSRRFSIFLQTHIFWNFDYISRIYNQINYRNIWFPKVIRIFIITALVLFLCFFSEKDPHHSAVEPFNLKILDLYLETWLYSPLLCTAKVLTGEWIYEITWKHTILTILFIFYLFCFIIIINIIIRICIYDNLVRAM